jgi:hypothetical protein
MWTLARHDACFGNYRQSRTVQLKLRSERQVVSGDNACGANHQKVVVIRDLNGGSARISVARTARPLEAKPCKHSIRRNGHVFECCGVGSDVRCSAYEDMTRDNVASAWPSNVTGTF